MRRSYRSSSELPRKSKKAAESMALSGSSIVPTKSFVQTQCLLPSSKPHHCSLPSNDQKPRRIVANASESAKNPIVSDAPAEKKSVSSTVKTVQKVGSEKWAIESWKSKKALQLPEYPNQEELHSVLHTLEAFPPIVFAGEARSLEERLAEAAMGNAFLLQGGDCAESFKEFNANNIRDTFRILLQMGVVLMFGGQMPVIKVSFRLLLYVIFIFFDDFD